MNDNKLLVGIDLDIGLKLYTVPKNELKRLKKNFSNINFQFMNTKKNPKIIKDIDIYWGNRIDKKIISECKNLKWIHFGSVGVDRARTRDIFDRKILVTNSSEIMDRAIVESIIQFITNFARGYFLCQDLRNKNNLSRETFDKYFDQIKNLEDQTCLIVGFGSIGKKLAKVCEALGMNIIGINQREGLKKNKNLIIENKVNLAKNIRKADFIVNLLPHRKETENLFNEDLFNRMKKTSFFINVGRGETVNENALIKALKEKKIAGAGLDVFKNEPLSPNSLLFKMKNVLITPHIAGLSNNYWKKQTDLFSSNLDLFIKNKKNKMINRVNMKKFL